MNKLKISSEGKIHFFFMVAGLTYTGGMCDGDRSAAVIQADGFNSAFSLAHQIGHRYVLCI